LAPTATTILVRGELELNPAGCDRLEEEPNIFTLTPGQFGGTLSWYASPKTDQYHTDGLQAENAEWLLKRCADKPDRPFFLGLGFFRPHTPYVSPKSYFEMYPAADMPVVQEVAEDQKDLPKQALGSYKKEQDKLTGRSAPAGRPGVFRKHQLHGRAGWAGCSTP